MRRNYNLSLIVAEIFVEIRIRQRNPSISNNRLVNGVYLVYQFSRVCDTYHLRFRILPINPQSAPDRKTARFAAAVSCLGDEVVVVVVYD